MAHLKQQIAPVSAMQVQAATRDDVEASMLRKARRHGADAGEAVRIVVEHSR